VCDWVIYWLINYLFIERLLIDWTIDLFLYFFIYWVTLWVTEWVWISNGHMKPVRYYNPTFIRRYGTEYSFHAELSSRICTAFFCRTLLPSESHYCFVFWWRVIEICGRRPTTVLALVFLSSSLQVLGQCFILRRVSFTVLQPATVRLSQLFETPGI